MDLTDQLCKLIDEVLALGGRLGTMDERSPLLGVISELDSVGVVAILTALEDRYGIAVEDDEICAETFATLGTLIEYVRSKQS